MAAGWVKTTVLVVAGALALAACGSGGASNDVGEERERPERDVTETTTSTPADLAVAGTQVAQATGPRVEVFAESAADEPTTTLDNPNENGAPLVFLVEQDQGEWLQVLLPIRPNGSMGWIRAADVTLASNSYTVDIALADHRLLVRNGDAVVVDTAIGVGTASTPTPGGKYYIKELLQPPDPDGAYGPFAYGLSGFSNVLDDFNGGDGVIGIHGTNEPEAIGSDVSHGCIRVDNETITQMAGMLPLGTPVHINP